MNKPPVVVVSTCSRPTGVSYLADTLDSLDRAGAGDVANDRIVLCNGPFASDVTIVGWTVHAKSDEFRSSRSNFWHAVRLAAYWATDLLFFEDDIHCCKNAVTRMASVRCPDDAAFVSFYDHAHPRQRRANGAWGLHVAPLPEDFDGAGYGGTQALLLPLRTCQYLAPLDPFSIRIDCAERQCDKVLADFCAVSPWPRFAMHVPTLVRHTGMVSAVRPGVEAPTWRHSPRSYPGDWFDALASDGPRMRRSVLEEP